MNPAATKKSSKKRQSNAVDSKTPTEYRDKRLESESDDSADEDDEVAEKEYQRLALDNPWLWSDDSILRCPMSGQTSDDEFEEICSRYGAMCGDPIDTRESTLIIRWRSLFSSTVTALVHCHDSCEQHFWGMLRADAGRDYFWTHSKPVLATRPGKKLWDMSDTKEPFLSHEHKAKDASVPLVFDKNVTSSSSKISSTSTKDQAVASTSSFQIIDELRCWYPIGKCDAVVRDIFHLAVSELNSANMIVLMCEKGHVIGTFQDRSISGLAAGSGI